MRNRLFRWLSPSRGRLRTKLLWVYFLLVALPLGLFTLYAYLRVRGAVEQQTFAAAQNAFDDTRLSLQQIFSELDGVLGILSSDPLVYAMASNDPGDFTYIRRLEDSDQLSLTFRHLCDLSGVGRIRLYVNNDYPYAASQSGIVQISEVENSGWFGMLSEQGGRRWFSPPDFADQPAGEREWYSSMQVIYNPREVNTPLAVLRADVDAGRIARLAGDTSITENGTLFLLRGSEVLYSTSPAPAGADLAELVGNLPPCGSGRWDRIRVGGKSYYAQCSALSDPTWHMVSVLPTDDVLRLSRQLRTGMLLVVIVLAVAAYALAYTISRSSLERISLLTRTMQAVEKGDVTARLEPIGDDEIAQLMGSFSQMMERIDTLMEEKVEQGRQIKNLELKALQAQINPHFLYNSLDLINCTAIANDVPQISHMVHELSQFYRLSLSRGREVIPLADELRHAQLYVDIQNMRFEGRVRAEWQLDPAAGRCRVIKIILQPLIENAIIHGIFETPAKTGRLLVRTCREEGRVVIVIQDDGAGMDEATRLANFAPPPPGGIAETMGGYGVRNIYDRLRIAYGAPYGLFCESGPGKGTTVTVIIPAIEPEEPEEEDAL